MNGGSLYFLGKLLSCQLLQGKEVDRAGGQWGRPQSRVPSPLRQEDSEEVSRTRGQKCLRSPSLGVEGRLPFQSPGRCWPNRKAGILCNKGKAARLVTGVPKNIKKALPGSRNLFLTAFCGVGKNAWGRVGAMVRIHPTLRNAKG